MSIDCRSSGAVPRTGSPRLLPRTARLALSGLSCEQGDYVLLGIAWEGRGAQWELRSHLSGPDPRSGSVRDVPATALWPFSWAPPAPSIRPPTYEEAVTAR
ncbi:hypothetical protein GCM10009603_60350 [Nocardiopsis exhalans]